MFTIILSHSVIQGDESWYNNYMKLAIIGNNNFSWLKVDAEEAARRLLGCQLVSEIDGRVTRVRIVEVEAYDQDDEASHAFRGRTKRNDAMFQEAGHLYVYFTYGMHYCCNIVCGEEGFGSGVLVRAVEPLEGVAFMENRRGKRGIELTNGPGKVCQALGIDLSFAGHDLSKSPIKLVRQPRLPEKDIVAGPRIGISKAVHELRRFYIANNPYVSRR